MKAPVRLTVLSDMAGHEWSGPAGHDPRVMLDQAVRWGLTTIDLKTVLGKNVADLSDDETEQVAAALAASGVEVQAVSTLLMKLTVEDGEAAFHRHLAALDRTLVIARRLRPRMIRLLAADTAKRQGLGDSWPYLQREHPWLLRIYAEAVTRIHAAGFEAVIENECGGCIFSTPSEVVSFFTALGRTDQVRFIWDVQNLWQMGVFPTMAVYRQLAPFIGFYHVKGGRCGPDSPALIWRAPLENASWPVLEITRAVIAEGLSPVICINPSHGQPAPGENRDNYTARDLAFLRRHIPEIE